METQPMPSAPITPTPETTPEITPSPEVNTGSQPQTDAVSSPNMPPPPPTPKVTIPIIIAVLVTAIIVSGVFYGISRMKPKETAVAPTPTPMPVVTPTPIRQPSAIATDSAFIEFQNMVATLSAAIAGYSPQDPSLTPPTLVLPLGFSQ